MFIIVNKITELKHAYTSYYNTKEEATEILNKLKLKNYIVKEV